MVNNVGLDPSIRNAVGGFQPGACEFEYINSVTDFIVALNKPDFGSFPRASSSPACGQCLQVTGPKGTIQVQVVDMCPGCKSGSLDFTPGAFSKIADLDQGRVPISWRRC
ncbi:RlpA-like double-psi beta-barrel-protein domain-containing protein-containing protein [Mortierella sp. GBAus27b]|nr:RlpA-like double-psi beta-barrel-protein domain-containing protein-containing protein [Mortierella sp. GBAus27b]